MARLIGQCSETSLSGLRNRALIVVLWRTGLRCSEALALRGSDIDPAAGTVRVLHGKGRKARTVGCDPQALAVVQAWADAKAAAGITGGPLFCTIRSLPGRPAGKRLQPRYARALLERLAADAGIDHRVHPHGLRHTMAVELSREGWPVSLIQRQLGHASVATTSIYLDHLNPQEVIDRARSRRWA